jgi:hypothetical protein
MMYLLLSLVLLSALVYGVLFYFLNKKLEILITKVAEDRELLDLQKELQDTFAANALVLRDNQTILSKDMKGIFNELKKVEKNIRRG